MNVDTMMDVDAEDIADILEVDASVAETIYAAAQRKIADRDGEQTLHAA